MTLMASSPTETAEEVVARHLVRSPWAAARTTSAWEALGDVRAVHDQLVAVTAEAAAGELRRPAELLMAQSVALDTMFNVLARRAGASLDAHPEAAERFLRLALKAQSQSRATLESLGLLLHPRAVAFVRQDGGAMQINMAPGAPGAPGAVPRAHGATEPTKLLGDEHGERLDRSATRAAIGGDPALAPVGARDRPEDGGG
jgi:hypothetical protein